MTARAQVIVSSEAGLTQEIVAGNHRLLVSMPVFRYRDDGGGSPVALRTFRTTPLRFEFGIEAVASAARISCRPRFLPLLSGPVCALSNGLMVKAAVQQHCGHIPFALVLFTVSVCSKQVNEKRQCRRTSPLSRDNAFPLARHVSYE